MRVKKHNMKTVQQEKRCDMYRVQHEKRREYNTK